MLAGIGVGLVLSPANTDALNRVPILENKANLESTLSSQGIPKAQAGQIADSVTQGSGGSEATLAEHAGAHAIGRTLLYFDLEAEAAAAPARKRWRERLPRRTAPAEA